MTGHQQTGLAQVKALVVAVRGFLEGTRVRAAWMEPACYVLFGVAMMALATQAHFLWAVIPLGGIGVICGIGRHLETLEWQEQAEALEADTICWRYGMEDGTAQQVLFEWQEFLEQGEDACDPFEGLPPQGQAARGSATAASMAAELNVPHESSMVGEQPGDDVWGHYWFCDEVPDLD
jgi:hypothetical protein